jgi:hypothetical protein
MTNKQLIKKLEQAYQVCRDCGHKYGVYSVGCSSVWEGVCNVCDEYKPVTETRDYGYLVTGIRKLIKEGETRAKIKEQSKEVAEYMLKQEPIMTDEDLDRVMKPSYLQGEITLNLTEEEVGFLHQCLDTLQECHYTLQTPDLVSNDVRLFEEVEKKITELYEEHCVKYQLSEAMKAYHAKYNTFGMDDALDTARWEGFRDAFTMNAEVAK